MSLLERATKTVHALVGAFKTVLQPGSPAPANGTIWLREVSLLLAQANLKYLSNADFCVVCVGGSSEDPDKEGDPEGRLLLMRARDAAAAQAKLASISKPESSAEVKTGEVQVKLEHDDFGVNLFASSAVGETVSAVQSLYGQQIFYTDPLTGKRETADQHYTRMFVWNTVLATVVPHHLYLSNGVASGDVAALLKVVLRLVNGLDADRVVNALVLMCAHRKTSSVPMSKFISDALKLNQILTSSRDVTLAVGARVRLELVYMALGGDPAYKIDVALARKSGIVTVETLLNFMRNASLVVERANGQRRPITGLAALPKSKSVCFDFKKGKCARGGACAFAHSLSAPDPRDRDLKKKAAAAKAVCAECKGAHAVDDCDIFKARHERSAELEARELRRVEAEASAAAYVAAQPGSVVTGVVASMAEGFVPRSILGTGDPAWGIDYGF